MTTLVCSIRNICRWLDLIVQNGVSCNLNKRDGLAVSTYFPLPPIMPLQMFELWVRKGKVGKLTGLCILTDNVNDSPLFPESFIYFLHCNQIKE